MIQRKLASPRFSEPHLADPPDMPDDPGPSVPTPTDPVPEPPGEVPPGAPPESPGTPAPDMPPSEPPEELPDLPEGPNEDPTHPDTPEELPDSPSPDLPPGPPEETPGPSDPMPADVPQEIPTNPGYDGPLTMRARVTLRPATPLDAGALGEIMTQATQAATWKPRLHSSVEDIAHAGRMIDLGWITVAELDGCIAGFLAREGGYVHGLYIADGAQGRGLGRALLQDAKARRDRLDLWTLQRNTGARRFYRREGFAEGETTPGRHNDEGLPDVHFTWCAA
ncbi:GNAT family N-acetyltransferase [Sagittula salina]